MVGLVLIPTAFGKTSISELALPAWKFYLGKGKLFMEEQKWQAHKDQD